MVPFKGDIYIFIHCRKRKASTQEKSSNKLEVPTGGRKRKRKSSEIKAEDGYVSGSSGADDNPQEVRKQNHLVTTTSSHAITGTRKCLKQHAQQVSVTTLMIVMLV